MTAASSGRAGAVEATVFAVTAGSALPHINARLLRQNVRRRLMLRVPLRWWLRGTLAAPHELAAATAVVWAAQERRQVLADLAAMDAETRALVVAVRWRLQVADGDAARIARLVAPRRTVSRGPVSGRMPDRVESFARLSDAEAAALAQRAGVRMTSAA